MNGAMDISELFLFQTGCKLNQASLQQDYDDLRLLSAQVNEAQTETKFSKEYELVIFDFGALSHQPGIQNVAEPMYNGDHVLLWFMDLPGSSSQLLGLKIFVSSFCSMCYLFAHLVYVYHVLTQKSPRPALP